MERYICKETSLIRKRFDISPGGDALAPGTCLRRTRIRRFHGENDQDQQRCNTRFSLLLVSVSSQYRRPRRRSYYREGVLRGKENTFDRGTGNEENIDVCYA